MPEKFEKTTIKVPVTFEFEVTGEEGDVMKSIHEQIMTDVNEYNQFLHDNAVLQRILIHEWRR